MDKQETTMTEREERLLVSLHRCSQELGQRHRAMSEAVSLLSVALAAFLKDKKEGTHWRGVVVEERIALAIEELSKPMGEPLPLSQT